MRDDDIDRVAVTHPSAGPSACARPRAWSSCVAQRDSAVLLAITVSHRPHRATRPETLDAASGQHDLPARPERRLDRCPARKKSEFHAESGKVSQLWNVECPVPVVAYRVDSQGHYDSALMVLEAAWREPLGAISPESLEAEGFESFAHFRRAWCIREKRRFRPLHTAAVFRVRPCDSGDDRAMADVLLQRLYGEFLAAGDGHSYRSTTVAR